MNTSIQALAITAATIGIFHTVTGPDHYIPFAVIAKARNYNRIQTVVLVILCGIGHVGSSVILGFIGVAAGLGVNKLQVFEGFRGSIATWMLIIFGLIYGLWGLRKALHKHHHHHHGEEHDHSHEMNDHHHHFPIKKDGSKLNLTPWILFMIFVFGPCEPLIPLLIYPAANQSIGGAMYISLIFGLVTIATMMVMVFIVIKGFDLLPLQKIHRYTHAMAGFTIFLCGVCLIIFGL